MSVNDQMEPDDMTSADGPEQLCGGALWDVHYDYEQMEALSFAVQSSCELGFERVICPFYFCKYGIQTCNQKVFFVAEDEWLLVFSPGR